MFIYATHKYVNELRVMTSENCDLWANPSLTTTQRSSCKSYVTVKSYQAQTHFAMNFTVSEILSLRFYGIKW